jgi:hypothetical protein
MTNPIDAITAPAIVIGLQPYLLTSELTIGPDVGSIKKNN